jgi:hypothetical protein
MTQLTITERDWQAKVIDAAKLFGWRWAHFRPARTAGGWRTAFSGHAGFPDLVLLRGGRLILAELKAGRGLPTPDQQEWLRGFAEVELVEAYCWYPDDWQSVYTTLAKESTP